MNEYSELVMTLHDVARTVEFKLGQCQLTEKIRQCADILHELGEPLKAKE